MALRRLIDMRHDDEDMYDLAKGMPADYEPPEYPFGLQFMLRDEDLEKAGVEDGEPGDTCRFAALGEVTSIFKGREDCRVEVQLTHFAGEDGQFVELSQPGHICLGGSQLGKMDMEPDCEVGDMIHLIGTVRLENTASTEFGDMATLQITEMTAEDESAESREG